MTSSTKDDVRRSPVATSMDSVRHRAVDAAWSAAGRIATDRSQIEMAIAGYEIALWQPIATAPRGSKIIMGWSPERCMEFQITWGLITHEGGGNSSGWVYLGNRCPCNIEFTHWRPLSPGPVVDGEVAQ